MTPLNALIAFLIITTVALAAMVVATVTSSVCGPHMGRVGRHAMVADFPTFRHAAVHVVASQFRRTGRGRHTSSTEGSHS